MLSFVLLAVDVEEEVEPERGLVGSEEEVLDLSERDVWEVGLMGTLCERASGEPFFEEEGLVHLERPKAQFLLSTEVTRERVGVSREGVGVSEMEEVEAEQEEESFLKGKGRRERDLGFDHWSAGDME